jgi:hypothetical protein
MVITVVYSAIINKFLVAGDAVVDNEATRVQEAGSRSEVLAAMKAWLRDYSKIVF